MHTEIREGTFAHYRENRGNDLQVDMCIGERKNQAEAGKYLFLRTVLSLGSITKYTFCQPSACGLVWCKH